MSPFRICKYIESSFFGEDLSFNKIDDNNKRSIDNILLKQQLTSEEVTDFNTKVMASLRNKVFTPKSELKPLSASATCISVIPDEADMFVPKNLKRLWFDMQKNFFEFQENNLKTITYESLLERLEQLWKIKEGDDGVGEESSYKVKPLLTSKLSRSNRKSQSSRTKAAAKLMNDMESMSKISHTNRRSGNGNGNGSTSVTSTSSNGTAVVRNSDIKESYTFDSVNSWTVLTTVEDLKSVGYKRTFKNKKIKLPVQGFIPFKTPKFPKGVRVLKTTNINEKVRLN
jgi:hypothetical protein